MRIYTLTIEDKNKRPLLRLTEESNYQIIASISTSDISITNTFNIVEIYNCHSLFHNKNFKDCMIILECGYKEDSISKLQAFDTNKIMMKPILKAYIWDIMSDFSQPPNNKVIIRTRPFLSSDIQMNKENKEITLIYKKNTFIFDFVKDILNQYAKIDIEPNIQSIRSISNTTNDISFKYNPNDGDVIKQLNNFLSSLSINKKGLKLNIIAGVSGYELGYSNMLSLPEDILQEVKQNLQTLERNEIKANTILKPPSFVNALTMQIQTILMPSIKVGTILSIKDDISVKLKTDMKFLLEQKTIGLWYVTKVTYNVSIYDQAPTAFSNIMELVQIKL